MKVMHWIAVSLLPLTLSLAVGSSHSLADPLDDCNSADAVRKVAGCTALISARTLKGPDLALAHSLRADGLTARGELDRAIADLGTAIEIDGRERSYRPRLAVLLELRAIEHLAQSRIDPALDDLARAISLAGGVATLHKLKADALARKGDAVAALATYSAALSLDAALGDARLGRAELLLSLKEPVKAAEDLAELLRQHPRNATALVLRGLAREGLDDKAGAIEDYRGALSVTNDAVARSRLAVLAPGAGLPAGQGKPRAEDLARALQRALQAAGCDPGAVDGKWGAKGKAALALFEKRAKRAFETDEPSQETIDEVLSAGPRSCALQCGEGESLSGGACVAASPSIPKAKPSAQSPPSKQAQPAKEKPKAREEKSAATGLARFDGNWALTVRSRNCAIKSGVFRISISGGAVRGLGSTGGSGRISSSGAARWVVPSFVDGYPIVFTATLGGSTGSGRYARDDGRCNGSFAARKG